MIDKLISILLIASTIGIFIGKKTELLVFSLILLVFIKVLKEKKFLDKWVILLVIIIGVYNYIKVSQYFELGYSYLNQDGVIQYMIRLVGIISILQIFSYKKYVGNIYMYIKKLNNILLISIIIAQIYLIYLLISGKGFVEVWGLRNFVGASYSPHIYSYTLILMVTVIEWLYITIRDKRIFLLYFIPILTAFLSGARTPIISMALIIIATRFIKNKKKNNIKYITLFSVIIISIFIILFSKQIYEYMIGSNLVEKFISTKNSGNFTNGRTFYWGNSLSYFINTNIINKMLGCGIYYTVLINKYTANLEIWAHSDIVDILVSYGMIMLIIYIISYIKYFRFLFKLQNYKKRIFLIMLSLVLLITTNGFVNYTVILPVLCFISIIEYHINYEK